METVAPKPVYAESISSEKHDGPSTPTTEIAAPKPVDAESISSEKHDGPSTSTTETAAPKPVDAESISSEKHARPSTPTTVTAAPNPVYAEPISFEKHDGPSTPTTYTATEPANASQSNHQRGGAQPSAAERCGHSCGAQPSPSEQHDVHSTPNAQDTDHPPNSDPGKSSAPQGWFWPSYFRIKCSANNKYITCGEFATDGEEPTFEDLQEDAVNQLWAYDKTEWTLTAVAPHHMRLCVVNEGGMRKVIMHGDTNKQSWFEFKEDGTIRCKHGCLDGNVKAGKKRKIAADILCWKHHGKSNQRWLRRHIEPNASDESAAANESAAAGEVPSAA